MYESPGPQRRHTPQPLGSEQTDRFFKKFPNLTRAMKYRPLWPGAGSLAGALEIPADAEQHRQDVRQTDKGDWVRFRFLFPLIVLVPGAGLAGDRVTAARSTLTTCYESAETLDAKFACFGNAVQECRASGAPNAEAILIPCIEAETVVWEEIRQTEYELMVQAIRDGESSGNPCQPSTEVCLDQLRALDEGMRSDSAIKCQREGTGQAAAGYPELARAACAFREAAHGAINMRAVRERFN